MWKLFFWDEIKSRALCDIGNDPIACLPLNILGSALLTPSFIKWDLPEPMLSKVPKLLDF